MRDPYEILGLSKGSAEAELRARYEELKAIYKEGRFKSGAEGMQAAKKLNELEEAWKDIEDELNLRSADTVVESESVEGESVKDEPSEEDKRAFAKVDELIRVKKYDEAQEILDNIMQRTGEWHYLQSRIFFYRDWLVECQKQLEIAVQCDPENEKYKTALSRLKEMLGNKNADPNTINNGNNGQNAEQQQQNLNAGNALVNCCTTYCCMSLCFDMCCRCI